MSYLLWMWELKPEREEGRILSRATCVQDPECRRCDAIALVFWGCLTSSYGPGSLKPQLLKRCVCVEGWGGVTSLVWLGWALCPGSPQVSEREDRRKNPLSSVCSLWGKCIPCGWREEVPVSMRRRSPSAPAGCLHLISRGPSMNSLASAPVSRLSDFFCHPLGRAVFLEGFIGGGQSDNLPP